MNVKVFISQVKTAGIADAVINDCDLTMIPVIHEYVEERNQRIKDPAPDTLLIQTIGEFRPYKTNASEIVINEAYFDAFRYFL